MILKSDFMTSDITSEEKEEKKEEKKSSWEGVEGLASFLGEWAWIILIIEAVIFIFWGILGLSWFVVAGSAAQQPGAYAGQIAFYSIYYIMYLIGGILTIVLAIFFVKPRFSNKWADKDYDYLLNDVIKFGNVRIPTMLIIGIIIDIFLQFWGGLIILIPLLLLIFMGPKEYKWKEE